MEFGCVFFFSFCKSTERNNNNKQHCEERKASQNVNIVNFLKATHIINK